MRRREFIGAAARGRSLRVRKWLVGFLRSSAAGFVTAFRQADLLGRPSGWPFGG
jgi:hypothetical protein